MISIRQAGDVLRNTSEHRGIGGKLWLFTVFLPRRYTRPSSLCHTPESQKETSISQVSKANETGAIHLDSFGKPPCPRPGQSDILWQPDRSAGHSLDRPQHAAPRRVSPLPASQQTGVRSCCASARLKPLLQEACVVTPALQTEE